MLSENEVVSALLQYNFLPRQRKGADELPPLFSSASFTWDVALELLTLSKQKGGYDAIDVGQTRADGKLRIVSIPHPVAYAKLVDCMRENWPSLRDICSNRFSMLRPRLHADGRIFVMNYGDWKVKKLNRIKNNFAKKFLVRADIANFFGSIYTHALPWALVGMRVSKENLGQELWFNQLDFYLRNCKRNETNGILVGPGTSNIISEVILREVDGKLDRYDYVRYIDDYTCYCETIDEANKFLLDLETSLRRFKLSLNHRKTKIESLPASTDAPWVLEVRDIIDKFPLEIKPGNAVHVLDRALLIGQAHNEPSVMKYIFSAITKKNLHYYTPSVILEYGFSILGDYPAIFSKFEPLMDMMNGSVSQLSTREKILGFLQSSIVAGRTDMVCWSIYYLNKIHQKVDEDLFQEILSSRDCLPLLLCHRYGTATQQEQVIEFAKSAVQAPDPHDRHQYWLLLYELFRINAISKVGQDKIAFNVMKNNGVQFLEY